MSENKMENIRNHFCEGEIEAFKICNDIGQRNYRNSQRFKKEGESLPQSGWSVRQDPDGEIENSGKSIFEIRIPNFCYIQVIVFDLKTIEGFTICSWYRPLVDS